MSGTRLNKRAFLLLHLWKIATVQLLCSCSVLGQEFGISASNQLRLGDGHQASLVDTKDKHYLEEMFSTVLTYHEFSAGLRLDYDSAPEYGPLFRGLRKKYLEYRDNGLCVRIGDSPVLLDKGLALNLFEKKPLAFDTELEGITAQYETNTFDVRAVWGAKKFLDYSSGGFNAPPKEDRFTVQGLSAHFKILESWNVGGNFVYAKSRLPGLLAGSNITVTKTLPELTTKVTVDSLEIFVDAVYSVNTVDGKTDVGKASTYALVSYWGESAGLSLEYRDYRFDPVDPVRRGDFTRSSSIGVFEYPPSGYRDHTFSLLNRESHVPDFNDEVGLRLDAFLTLSSDLQLDVTGSLSSRHYAYQYSISGNAFQRVFSGTSYFPSAQKSRSPSSEVFLQGEWHPEKGPQTVILGVDGRTEVLYNDMFPPYSETDYSITPVALCEGQIVSGIGFKATYEHRFGSREQGPGQVRFVDIRASLEVVLGSFVSLGPTAEWTTDPAEPTGKTCWMTGTLTARPSPAHQFAFSYGSERGGRVCSGGVCRILQPFDGMRFTSTNTF